MLASRRHIRPGFVELPLLGAVGAMPLPGIVMPLVLKTHRDMVPVEHRILDQAVLMLFAHLRFRKAAIAARPSKNSERLRQRLSSV